MQWEYQTMLVDTRRWDTEASTDDFDQKLASLGRQGWEMTAALPIANGGDTKAFYLFFKRPLDGHQ